MTALTAAELYRVLVDERYQLRQPAPEFAVVGVIPGGGADRPVDEQRAEAIGLRERYRWSTRQIARLLRVDEDQVTRWIGQPADIEVSR